MAPFPPSVDLAGGSRLIYNKSFSMTSCDLRMLSMFKRPTLLICSLVLFCLGVVAGCTPAVEQPSSPSVGQAPASTTIPVDEAPPSTTTP